MHEFSHYCAECFQQVNAAAIIIVIFCLTPWWWKTVYT